MKRDPGDILDRLSIAILKVEKIGEAENKKEEEMFRGYFRELKKDHPEVLYWDEALNFMKLVNSMTWELEWSIREEALDKDIKEITSKELKHIGHDTMFIRRFNILRVQFKNLLNIITDEGVQNVDKDRRGAIAGDGKDVKKKNS